MKPKRTDYPSGPAGEAKYLAALKKYNSARMAKSMSRKSNEKYGQLDPPKVDRPRPTYDKKYGQLNSAPDPRIKRKPKGEK